MNTRAKQIALLIGCIASLLSPSVIEAAHPVPHAYGMRQHCHHVINLLMRYGGSHGARTHTGAIPYGDGLILGNDIGDLELVSVAMLADGTETIGPTFAVTIRNNSHRDVSRFSVSAVAVLGRIRPMSPSTTVKVGKLCAGQELELHLQLPVECLAMGRAGNELLAFKSLVVAIDSFDELLECNESNNISVLDRATIPVAAPVVAQPEAVEEAPAETPVSPTAPGQQPPAEGVPADPTAPKAPSKLEDIDIDNLSLQLSR